MTTSSLSLLLLVLVLGVAHGHICIIHPRQVGPMNVSIPGSHDCYRRTPYCGGFVFVVFVVLLFCFYFCFALFCYFVLFVFLIYLFYLFFLFLFSFLFPISDKTLPLSGSLMVPSPSSPPVKLSK